MMRQIERRARDAEAIEKAMLEEMIGKLKNPDTPEAEKKKIRERLNAYRRELAKDLGKLKNGEEKKCDS